MHALSFFRNSLERPTAVCWTQKGRTIHVNHECNSILVTGDGQVNGRRTGENIDRLRGKEGKCRKRYACRWCSYTISSSDGSTHTKSPLCPSPRFQRTCDAQMNLYWHWNSNTCVTPRLTLLLVLIACTGLGAFLIWINCKQANTSKIQKQIEFPKKSFRNVDNAVQTRNTFRWQLACTVARRVQYNT